MTSRLAWSKLLNFPELVFSLSISYAESCVKELSEPENKQKAPPLPLFASQPHQFCSTANKDARAGGFKKHQCSRAQWLTPVIPALWEAEGGGSRGQEFKTSLANMIASRSVTQAGVQCVLRRECGPGTVVHDCNPSTLRGRRRADHLRLGVRDQPGQHGETPTLIKNTKISQLLGKLRQENHLNPGGGGCALWESKVGGNPGVQGQPGQYSEALSPQIKIKKLARYGGTPVIPVTWKAEADELLEPRRSRLQ
ncbi:NANOG neighbor homeobox [Plecturocebus cupreus]